MILCPTSVHFHQIILPNLHFWQRKKNINVENFKIEFSHYTTTITIPLHVYYINWNGWGYARRSYLPQKFDNYYFSFTKAHMFKIDQLIAQLLGYSSTGVIITSGTITHTILFNCLFYITLQTTFWDRNLTFEYI